MWTQSQSNNVFFSDESKYNVFGNDGKNFGWRISGERLSTDCTKKTVTIGGGSIVIWGMKSAADVGPFVRIQGTEC